MRQNEVVLPIPKLDLLNILTLAQDIADDPTGRESKKFAGQIIEECTEEMGLIAQWAAGIRETNSGEERIEFASRIIERIEEMLNRAETEQEELAIPA